MKLSQLRSLIKQEVRRTMNESRTRRPMRRFGRRLNENAGRVCYIDGDYEGFSYDISKLEDTPPQDAMWPEDEGEFAEMYLWSQGKDPYVDPDVVARNIEPGKRWWLKNKVEPYLRSDFDSVVYNGQPMSIDEFIQDQLASL